MHQLLKNGLFSIRFSLSLIFILIFSSAYAESENRSIALLLSKNTKHYSQFAEKLSQHNGSQNNAPFSIFYPDDLSQSLKNNSKYLDQFSGLVVAGDIAADSLSNVSTNIPIIFTLLPDHRVQHYINTNPNCQIKGRCSGVFLNQPLKRLLQITNKAFPSINTLAIFVESGDKKTIHTLESLNNQFKFNILLKLINEGDNIVSTTHDIGHHADVLLAIANKNIYNRKTAKGILLSAYNNNIPIIGYSRSFVKAGALFSIFSSTTQIAEHVSDLTTQLYKGSGTLPAPEYPKYFSIQINRAVKQSLEGKLVFDSSITKYSKSKRYE
ncbi:MAG: hypothetical protein OQK73_07645 [Gammaproteobacteria bacterium]|nr:hypothetical protein [Gammaproteobacteria bacterium]